jgi:hypothetical protein
LSHVCPVQAIETVGAIDAFLDHLLPRFAVLDEVPQSIAYIFFYNACKFVKAVVIAFCLLMKVILVWFDSLTAKLLNQFIRAICQQDLLLLFLAQKIKKNHQVVLSQHVPHMSIESSLQDFVAHI